MKAIYWIIFVATTLAGCSKNENGDPLKPIKDNVIRINSGVETSTKAVVADASALPNVQFLRRDMTTDVAPDSYAGIVAIEGDRDADGDIVFKTPEPIYATNNDNAFFLAYWPQGNIVSDVVTWTVDAKTDILITQSYNAGKHSAPIDGKTTGQPMMFKHQLAQLEVICVADNTAGLSESIVQSTWGKITKIELLETNSVMTFSYDKPLEVAYTTPVISMAMLKSDYESDFEPIALVHAPSVAAAGMFAPVATGTDPIKLMIYTEKVPLGQLIEVQLAKDNVSQGFKKGLRHTVTLGFKGNTSMIEMLSTTIDDWQAIYTNIDVPFPARPQVGDYYYSDGTTLSYSNGEKTPIGIVFWVDPTNPMGFKIHALDESAASAWTNNTKHEIGIATQHDADGRANIAALKAYVANNIDNEYFKTTTLTADFQAAGYCDTYTARGNDIAGSWYLPAKTELQHIWCAFNGVAPTSWNESYPVDMADDKKQAEWNEKIMMVGGTSFTTDEGSYWSSTALYLTEDNNSGEEVNKLAWIISMGKGLTARDGGNTAPMPSRCVKSTLPLPTHPDVGDYSNGGVVFWVDPADRYNYKIVALNDAKLVRDPENTKYQWIKIDNSTVVPPALQDETDGYKNSLVIRQAEATSEGAYRFPASKACNFHREDGMYRYNLMWYLPAKNELEEIYKVWNAADGKFKKAITDNEGTDFSNTVYWSSTQNSEDLATAHAVNFADGQSAGYTNTLTNLARCITK